VKKVIGLTLILVLGVILVACSEKEDEKEGELTRVDVQKVNEEGNYEDVITITDQGKLDLVKKTLEHVEWEPNTKPKMATKEDVLATLFYSFDKNMPERLYEYRIWFEANETATIISSNEKEGYGNLDKGNARNFKNMFFN